jgi:hypothetical protein
MRARHALTALCLATLLSGCSAGKIGTTFADLPAEWGGLPKGAPPRPGTPEYESWSKQRTIDAATSKQAGH